MSRVTAEVIPMKRARVFAALALLTTLALLAGPGSSGQEKDKKGDTPTKPVGRDQLPKFWDQLALTDAQRAEVLKLTAEQRQRRDKLMEEVRKLDEEYARKRVAILNDDQRKKLIDLVAGPPPKDKADPKAKGKDRDADVVVTSVSDARIPWPRCRRREGGGGGSGLLVDDTLVRAIKTESAAALMHWFGVANSTVWVWRRAFGVGQWGTPGSQRLLAATTAKANAACRGKPLPRSAVRDRRKRAKALDLGRHLRAYQEKRRAERPWSAADVARLGTMPDTRLAATLGRTRVEVRNERVRRAVPRYRKPPPPEAHLSPAERERLRRERIAVSKRGKPRPAHVVEAVRRAWLGKHHTVEARAKMRAAHRRRSAAASGAAGPGAREPPGRRA
jgi:Spy/CpxP family protein refolding chaperone